ncbi:TorF family putative porin [Stutzerimonas stutzeri]|uniref:TorF family putative porin n=1 Tax=Stutzerimonas sp. S1 TaxID=3030652 RepID=UPI0022254870|nr:TorF family putative porin [Stutzerimonas sp. S1]MCW3148966.1 TorF family putative porin [Stutzerimonas sp. S1]
MLKQLTVALTAVSTMGFSALAASETVPSAIGDFDVSMTATLASDYIWRGQSQTGGSGAVQGSLDIAHESGLYIGAWASNVDDQVFTGNSGGADMEVDYYVGYGGDLTDWLSYDLSWNTYTYPQASSYNVDEWIGKLSAYGFTVGAKYAYDPSSALYSFISYEYELPYEIGLGLAYGHTDTKNAELDADEQYNDWSVTLSKTIATLDVALMYSDTDISECVANMGYTDDDDCDANLTLSVSKSF